MKNYISAAIFSLAIIIGIAIAANAYKSKYRAQEIITVTGSSNKDFVADLIVWNASYNRQSMQLSEAFAQIKKDEEAVKSYLTKSGLDLKQVVFSSISIDKEYTPSYGVNGELISNKFNGYRLTQAIKVESKEMDKVELVSREISNLIQSGIELSSIAPQYYFTKLSDLKVKLLADAAKDARIRAEAIAENTNNKLGKLKSSYMGVFQITAQNSNEDYTYGGAYNTESKFKTATITVTGEFYTK
ncbi:MAG: SIMPL domain-containing protein [Bacteroidota bacterium]|nr:SIMPL domain-containing protein [Bacteroidota bacterium]